MDSTSSTDLPNGSTVLETERLRVRTADVGDADLYLALWTDPRVMKNVGFPRGLAVTRDGIAERLTKGGANEFRRLLVAELKETGDVIGECKLGLPDAEGVAGTDVKLKPEFWGHRYGVEIKQGLVDHLFTHTACDSVQGEPNVNNVPSIRMQEAVGARRIGESVCEVPPDDVHEFVPVHHYIYRVYRADWERRRATGKGTR